MTAADERWLYYGAAAGPVDRPDRTFGYVDDADHPRFGTFPTDFLDRIDVPVNEEQGRIELSELDSDLYQRFGNGFDRVDVGALSTKLSEETLFTPPETRVVVLYGWFDMTLETAAESLESDPDDIVSLIDDIRTRRQRAERTASIRFTVE